MKKKLIIFRFGSSMPTQKELGIIAQLTGGTATATGCATPFGVISIVETQMSPSEVVTLYNKVAADTGDCLPTIVFEEGDNVAYSFGEHFFPDFKETHAAFSMISESVCTLSMDELLTLVKKKGVEKLTEAELKRLKELSKDF